MIEKNASGKYVLTEEDAELLVRFSVYAKRTLANKRAEYFRKIKPILDHEHLYEDLSAADKKRCQGSPFTVEEILGENGYGKSSARAFSFCRSRSAWSSSCSIRTNLPPRRLPGSWGSPALQFGLTRKNALDKLKKRNAGG